MRRNDEERLREVVASRLLEVTARQLFRALGGRVPLDQLRSCAALAVRDIVDRWDGRGRFEAFAAQRLRWAMLRELRREERRELRQSLFLTLSDGPGRALSDGEDRQPPSRGWMREVAVGDRAYRLVYDPEEVPDPTRDIEQDVLRLQARRAVERLPEQEASLIHCHYYRGETLEEMAVRLGVSKSTVCERLGRAMDALRGELCSAKAERVVAP